MGSKEIRDIFTLCEKCGTICCDCKKEPTAARSLNEYDFPLIQCDDEGEIFCITPESRIYSAGVDITQDDAAIAKCFKRWVKIWGNIDL